MTEQSHPMPDAMLAKIRKLLAKAEDPATTPEEAESYTAKATELVAAYGIDEALLAEADAGHDRVGDRVVVLDAPYALDKAGLLATVATGVRCRVVQRERWVDGAKQLSLHLFGYGADLERAELLFTSLLLQATGQMRRSPVPRGDSVAAFRRSWLAGFAMAVGERLRAAERAAQQAAEQAAGQQSGQTGPAGADRGNRPSVALVLAGREDRVEAQVQEAYPQLGRARRRTLSGRGSGAGWAAGQQADLGGRRMGSGRSNALTR